MKIAREKIIFLIVSIFTLILLPIRTFQVMKGIGKDTGFITGLKPLNYAIYIIFLLAVFLIGILSFTDKNLRNQNQISNINNMLFAIPTSLMVIFLLFDAGVAMVQISMNFINTPLETMNPSPADLIRNGTFSLIFRAIFAVLSAVYFSLFSISVLKKDMKYKKASIMGLTPTIWLICKLMYQLINPIRFKNVPSLMFELAFLVTAILFFFYFASSIYLNIGVRSVAKVIFTSGLIIIIVSMNHFPMFLSYLTDKQDFLTGKMPEIICDFGIMLFAFCVLCVLVFSKKESVQTEEKKENLSDKEQKQDTYLEDYFNSNEQ